MQNLIIRLNQFAGAAAAEVLLLSCNADADADCELDCFGLQPVLNHNLLVDSLYFAHKFFCVLGAICNRPSKTGH